MAGRGCGQHSPRNAVQGACARDLGNSPATGDYRMYRIMTVVGPSRIGRLGASGTAGLQPWGESSGAAGVQPWGRRGQHRSRFA